jgi:NAD(P)-dependent dehydrogenase (short-subunit alcohol dehydrogenase family)
MACDVRDFDQVRAMMREAGARLDGVDILVNNAGIARNSAAEETSDEEWREVFDVNLDGVHRCCREFGSAMLRRGRGSIVNIGSMSGLVVNRPQPQAAYNASKAAVHMLTKSLAAEWAGRGVRVNAVAPGYIATELTKRGLSNRDWAARWIDMTPMGRVGERELDEEIHLLGRRQSLNLVGIISDDSTPGEKVHLGLVFLLETESPEFTVNEADLMTAECATMEMLRERLAQMETWSQIVFERAISPHALPAPGKVLFN